MACRICSKTGFKSCNGSGCGMCDDCEIEIVIGGAGEKVKDDD